jgi:hypothetical protein
MKKTLVVKYEIDLSSYSQIAKEEELTEEEVFSELLDDGQVDFNDLSLLSCEFENIEKINFINKFINIFN